MHNFRRFVKAICAMPPCRSAPFAQVPALGVIHFPKKMAAHRASPHAGRAISALAQCFTNQPKKLISRLRERRRATSKQNLKTGGRLLAELTARSQPDFAKASLAEAALQHPARPAGNLSADGRTPHQRRLFIMGDASLGFAAAGGNGQRRDSFGANLKNLQRLVKAVERYWPWATHLMGGCGALSGNAGCCRTNCAHHRTQPA